MTVAWTNVLCGVGPLMLRRRDFLAGVSASAIFAATPAISGINNPGHGSSSSFNGGRSQVNLNFIAGTTGEYPFINLQQTAQDWFFANNAAVPVTPDLLDADGWPNVFTGTNPSGGYASVFFGPGQAVRPGNYVVTWTGNGTIALNMTNTLVSGSKTGSGGFGRYVFSTTSTGAFDVRITTAGVTNMKVFHVDDEAALNAGQVFGTKFLARLREANFGVIRFLNWINSNNSNITTWATRKPVTHWSYGSSQKPIAIYGGVTTNSGSDYSCSAPSGGFSVTDKAMVSIVFNASCPVQQAASFTNGSANVTVTGHGQATGNQAYLQTAGTLPTNFSPNVSYFVTAIDANTLNYSLTSGGAAIVAGSAGSGTHTSFPNPTLKVGAVAAVQLMNQFCVLFPQSFIGYPVGGSTASFSTMVYDATLQALITFGGSASQGSSGITNGVPPEMCLSLCVAVGAYPYFPIPCLACDPATDFLPSLAALIKSTYPWMKPRFEPPNELWNTSGTVDTQYANAKALAYGWGSNAFHDWYGKALSILGQQAAAVYGIGNIGTTYQMICGVQTQGTPSGSNARLASTKFLTLDPNPVQSPYTRTAASGWTSRVAVANYFSPLERFTVQELIDAYSYSVTNAGNPTAQAALANGYVDTLLGAAGNYNLANNNAAFIAWQAWGAGFGIPTITAYEGGYSPDYLLSGDWSTGITGATAANPCVLTLATTSSNSEKSGMTGNPAVVGMSITTSAIVGMTQLNGNTYTVTNVAGNQVTINVDSSAFSAYVSGGTMTYVNSRTYSNALRFAGKLASNLQGYLTTNYNNLVAAGGEFPSCFQFGGPTPSSNVWSVLEDIYQTPDPAQWTAIVAFNH